MNPDTSKFEILHEEISTKLHKIKNTKQTDQLVRPNGEPVPSHWSIFKVGEKVIIKDYTFEIKYIGETSILLEPVGLPDLTPG